MSKCLKESITVELRDWVFDNNLSTRRNNLKSVRLEKSSAEILTTSSLSSSFYKWEMEKEIELNGGNFMYHRPKHSLKVSKGSVFRETSYGGSWFIVMVMQTHNNHIWRVQWQHSVKPKEREGGKEKRSSRLVSKCPNKEMYWNIMPSATSNLKRVLLSRRTEQFTRMWREEEIWNLAK